MSLHEKFIEEYADESLDFIRIPNALIACKIAELEGKIDILEFAKLSNPILSNPQKELRSQLNELKLKHGL